MHFITRLCLFTFVLAQRRARMSVFFVIVFTLSGVNMFVYLILVHWCLIVKANIFKFVFHRWLFVIVLTSFKYNFLVSNVFSKNLCSV